MHVRALTKTRQGFVLVVCSIVATALLTSCVEDERREIRLTPTSTVEAGVRVLVDNCPGPSSISLSVRDDTLWEITEVEVPAPIEGQDDESTTDADGSPVGTPGLAEFLVGQAPEGWTTQTPLEESLTPGIRYTISTEPDGQSVDFSTPDLAPGLLWDGTGNSQFNPDLIDIACAEPIDVGAFVQNLLLLTLLGATAAAAVIVTIILVLFVITRRFSRIRSLQRRAQRQE